MKIDLKHDLSTLTTVNELAINRLFDKATWCISDAVENAILSGDDTISVDIGFGCIIIKLGDENITYKFKPSRALDKAVINTVIDEKNELTLNVEANLVSKITNIYKEMF